MTVIPYEHIPLWLRCTNRHLIDPTYMKPAEKLEAKAIENRKLPPSAVREIRASTERVVDLTEQYGVSMKTIYRIKQRQAYADVEEE